METTERESDVRELAFGDAEPQEPSAAHDSSAHDGMSNDGMSNDALTNLEERIHRTIVLVGTLREEKEAAARELAATKAALSTARAELEESRAGNSDLSRRLSALQAEKAQVRNRLEKLLGHIDQLGAV